MLQKNKLIVFYTREYKGFAGFEARTKAVVKELKKTGFNVEIVSFHKYHKNICEKKLSYFKKIIINFKIFFKLIQLRPSVLVLQRVNHHLPAALLYLLFFNPKFILDIDDWEIKENLKNYFFNITNSITDNISKLLCGSAFAVTVSSDFLFNYYKKYSTRIYKIPTAINGEINFNINFKNINKCVWCGSIDRIDTLFEVQKMINSFEKFAEQNLILTIICRGYYINEIKIKKLNQIFIFKNIDNKYIPKMLSEQGIGLLPLFNNSKYNQSKSPVKLFEYMRNGLISISANTFETKNIIKNINYGFIVKNYKNMIDQINLLQNFSENEILVLSKNANFLFNKQYSLNEIINYWIKLL